MSGARLEAAGQVRNAYPFMVSLGFYKRLTLTTANSFTTETDLTLTDQLPFDYGPDKSSRVFIALNGLYSFVSVDAGATSIISGAAYYRGLDGRKIYIMAVSVQGGVSGFTVNNSGMHLGFFQSIGADSLSKIGAIGFENRASTIGTATNLFVDLYFNLGFYGDYAEPKWGELFDKISNHDHIGLPLYDAVID